MIVIGELGLELQERTRESHSVVLLGTSECALAMSHPVTGRSEPDRQRAFKLRFRWTPEYGHYVKYPNGAPQRGRRRSVILEHETRFELATPRSATGPKGKK
jgi:hypothetical protein